MERNRIQHFLTELTDGAHGAGVSRISARSDTPAASFVAMPPALWAELGGAEQAWLASMYERAFRQAEAEVDRACVERLLESIAIA